MTRSVKGTIFVDYVRMIRSQKGVDWSAELQAGDLACVQQRIQPDAWYPLETFERLGLAILKNIAGGNVEVARLWGRISLEDLNRQYEGLVAPGNPRESVMRFKVLRSSFFNFEAIEVTMLVDHEAHLKLGYQMCAAAEEAASNQTMGFFERLLEMAGATEIQAAFESRSWAGDPHTVLVLKWKN